MSSKARVSVPDAWDDDWEAVADKKGSEEAGSTSTVKPKISKAQKKAQHAEENRQLWKAAEEPLEPFMFLEAQDNVPLKSKFKGSVKVLSRQIKVASPSPSSRAVGRKEGGTIGDEEDSDDDALKYPVLSLAERQEKARREREEKQRKYQEAREKLFGPSNSNTIPSDSGDSSNRNNSNAQKSLPGKASGGFENSQKFRISTSEKRVRDGSSFLVATQSIEKPIRMPKGPEKVGRNGAGFVMNEKCDHDNEGISAFENFYAQQFYATGASQK